MLVRYNGFGMWVDADNEFIGDVDWERHLIKVNGVFSVPDANRVAVLLSDRTLDIEYLEQSNHPDAYRHPEHPDYLFMPDPNPVCFMGEDVVEDVVEPPIIASQDKLQNKNECKKMTAILRAMSMDKANFRSKASKLYLDRIKELIDKPHTKNERNSMLILIYQIAMEAYGYDPENPKNTATGDKNGISAKIATKGISVSNDTIKNYLDEAKLLPKQGD